MNSPRLQEVKEKLRASSEIALPEAFGSISSGKNFFINRLR
jgi:hypothetical protein